jgi:RNA polymerase sigma-70 factor (ECF subfamily)
MLGRCPEAEDVGQETFIRFYKALGSFRGDSSVATYVTRIAMNLSLNELKRRKRTVQLIDREDSGDVPDIMDPKSVSDPFESKELVQRALDMLNPDHRAVVVLRLMDGYSTEETAKLLKVPLGTVTSRLARAQLKLRDIIESLTGEPI